MDKNDLDTIARVLADLEALSAKVDGLVGHGAEDFGILEIESCLDLALPSMAIVNILVREIVEQY